MEISKDAMVALTSLWKTNYALKLTFNTPSRVHPRMKAALDELIGLDIIKLQRTPLAGPGMESHTYSMKDRSKLDAIPRMSDREMKKHSYPITVD